MPPLWLLLLAEQICLLKTESKGLKKNRLDELEEKNKVLEVIYKEKSEMEFDGKTYEFFRTTNKNNEVVGYAFTLSANGYGGAVNSVIGIDINGKVGHKSSATWHLDRRQPQTVIESHQMGDLVAKKINITAISVLVSKGYFEKKFLLCPSTTFSLEVTTSSSTNAVVLNVNTQIIAITDNKA